MFSTLIDALRGGAEARPDSVAYVFLGDGLIESSQLTYGQLDLRARAIAATLQAKSGKGDLVLLLFPAGLEFLEAFFGCMYSGNVAVPLPSLDGTRFKRSLPRLATVAEDAGATVILTTQSILAMRDQMCSHLPALASLKWLAVEEIGDSAAADWNRPIVAATDLAYLQYSSGSTSKPKGIMISHANVLDNVACLIASCPAAVSVTWLPHFHDYGLVCGLLAPVCSAGKCYVISPLTFLKRPVRWLQAISRYGATVSNAPVFGYNYCARKVRANDCTDLDLSGWTAAGISAEPIRPESIERFEKAFQPYGFRREIFCPAYGLAEATLVVSMDTPGLIHGRLTVNAAALEAHRVVETPEGATNARVLSASGRLQLAYPVRIVDPGTGHECSPGEVGEIWCAGANIALGYWNQPEETQRTFHARLATGEGGDFLRTGDLGFIAQDQLFVTGRLKDLIIIAGANHYPQDIEATVEASHADLRPLSSAAFSVDVEGQERLVIVAEARPREGELKRIQDSIRQAVVEHHGMDPYAIAILRHGGILKTSSGKIQRSACRAAFLTGAFDFLSEVRAVSQPDPDQPLPNGDGIREWLISRFAALAGIEPARVDVNQPLALYGMTSIEAVSTVAALEDWLHKDLSPTLLYRYSTIAALASWLAGENSDGAVAPLLRAAPAFEDPIAIVGMGCRFPGANGPDAFWQMLRDGVEAITEVPADRWDVDAFYSPEAGKPGKMNTRWGAFLRDVGDFDPQFFGISPREAANMDPQQRILLEVAVEALENAGVAPERVAGTQAGVFVGVCTSDYATLQARNVASLDTHSETGCALSIAANRISYTFDFRGPSLAIDTACSSSMTAVHLACESLRRGQSSMALAGGVNLILIPEWTVAASQAGMMSADGRCKAFDSGANGYVRGEGCGLVVLKRLADALRDGDPIVALIRGTAVNQDGRSNGLTAPNPAQQQQAIELALSDAGVAARDIGYVEAHGTGTPLGDPIEFQALAAAVGRGREADRPCLLGSVKANIGHLEAAAGIAGLMKAALALSHEEIPPQFGLNEVNPYIRIDGSGLRIATVATPWVRSETPRFAGVSCFGVGGSNGHAILEEAPRAVRDKSKPTRPLHLLTISAKTGAALQDAIRQFEAHLERHEGFPDIAYTSNTGRSHFAHRAAVVAGTSREAREILSGSDGVYRGVVEPGARPKIAFLFGNHGVRHAGMGWSLYETQSAFRGALDDCAEILKRDLNVSLMELLSTEETAISGPTLFALQWATAQVWKSWGIEPDAVVGIGTGEFAAACFQGSMALKDGLSLARAGADAQYEKQIEALAAQGCSVFINMGNDPHLPAPAGSLLLQCFAKGCDDWRMFLEGLGELYVRGAQVDWDGFANDYGARKVALPNYPFQRRRYWITAAPKDRNGSEPQNHAADRFLPGRRLLSPVIKDTVFQTEVSASSMPLLRDHVVYGWMVFPGSASIGIALAGVGAPLPISVRDCNLVEALVLLENDRPIPLQTIFSEDDPAFTSFQVVSLKDDRDPWRVHATGKIRTRSNVAPADVMRLEANRLEAIQARCKERVSGAELYSFLKRLSLDYGVGFQGVVEVWRRQGEALGRIRKPARAQGSDSPVFDAVLLDSCFHVVVAAVERDGVEEAFVPVQVGALDVFRKVPGEFWVRAVVRTSGSKSVSVLTADLYLFDDEGRALAELTKVTFRRVGRESLLGSATQRDYRDWLYRLEWQTKESEYYEGQLDDGQWLILADRAGAGEALRALLESRGQRAVCAYADHEVAIESTEGLPLRGVIDLWALDATEDQSRICGAAHRVVQAISRSRLPAAPRLCLVTRGTQSAGSRWPATSAAGATLWGFGNVLAAEHPELRTVMIDLDSELSVNEARFILADVLSDDGETRIAYRRGLRHVERLTRIRPPNTMPAPPSLNGDSTYLITGGLGAIGLEVAGWMAKRGARHLVLAGRSEGSDSAQNAIRALRKDGVEVVVRRTDVGDAQEVADLIAEIGRSGFPLRGVMHAAGVLKDGLAVQQDGDSFDQVMRPKVQGAWNLHLKTVDLPLEFFVMFSSAAAFMPNPGQASYAAANAFLDSLAHVRRGKGLTALSVNWGLWEGPGLAAGEGVQEQNRLASRGVGMIDREQGLAALDFLLSGAEAEIAVLPIDWKKYFAHFRAGAEPPFLSKLVTDVRSRSDDDEVQKRRVQLLGRLEEATAFERQEIVEDFIAQQIVEILKFQSREEVDLSAGFFDIGLDSMMAVELQSRIQTGLGISIPATAAFDQPNITALARFLLDEMLVFRTPSPVLQTGTADDLSEDQLLAMFADDFPEAAAATVGENS